MRNIKFSEKKLNQYQGKMIGAIRHGEKHLKTIQRVGAELFEDNKRKIKRDALVITGALVCAYAVNATLSGHLLPFGFTGIDWAAKTIDKAYFNLINTATLGSLTQVLPAYRKEIQKEQQHFSKAKKLVIRKLEEMDLFKK